MDYLLLLISYSPWLIVLLHTGALMYDTKVCNLMLQAECGQYYSKMAFVIENPFFNLSIAGANITVPGNVVIM